MGVREQYYLEQFLGMASFGGILMRISEKIVISMIAFIMLYSLLLDLNFTEFIPSVLKATALDVTSLSTLLFQVQATVATLAIALFAILSGSNGKVIYGVSVAEFILELRPRVLKHKSILIAILFSVCISFLLLTKGAYNSMVSLLLSLIIFITYLLVEIHTIFESPLIIRSEIRQYLLSVELNEKNLHKLLEEINYSIIMRDQRNIEYNIELLQSILKENSSSISVNGKTYLENSIIEMYIKRFNYANSGELPTIYHEISTFLRIVKDNSKNLNGLDIWDGIRYDFYLSLSSFDAIDSLDITHLTRIRSLLYNTVEYTDSGDRLNHHDLEYFLPMIFDVLIDNKLQKRIPPSAIDQLVKDHYTILIKELEYNNYSESVLTNILFIETLEYSKRIIDFMNFQFIKKTLLKSLNNYNFTSGDKILNRFFLVILVYFYHIIKYETSLSKRETEKIYEAFVYGKYDISNFLLMYGLETEFDINEANIITSILRGWKHSNSTSTGYSNIESATIEFFIYLNTYNIKSTTNLIPIIKNLIKGKELHYFNLTSSNRADLSNSYSAFVELFFGEIIRSKNDESSTRAYYNIESDIDRLVEVVESVYLQFEVLNGRNHSLSDNQVEQIEKLYNNKLESIVKNRFSFLKNNDHLGLQTYSEELEFSIKTFTRFLENNITQDLSIMFEYILLEFMRGLNDNGLVSIHKINYRNNNWLTEFFHIMSRSNLSYDSLIGYRDSFHGYELENKFRQFEQKCNLLKAERVIDTLCLESKAIDVSINSLSIKFEEYKIDELITNIEVEHDGRYKFEIISGVFVHMTESELREYILNTRAEIKMKMKYTVRTNSETVGFMIVHKSN